MSNRWSKPHPAINVVFIVFVATFTRPLFASDPVAFSAFMTTDLSQPYSNHSSLDASARAYVGTGVSYTLTDDWTAYASLQALRGNNGNLDTQDIQVYSNIDADAFSGLFDAWLEYKNEQNGTRVKLGQFDANSEFAAVSHAQEFINSSMGMSPTITFMPTYPTPTPGVAINQKITQTLSFTLGVFSDDSNRFKQLFSIVEVALHTSELALKTGIWHWDGDIARPNSTVTANGTRGIYLVTEGPLYVAGNRPDNFFWYLQAGWSEANANPVRFHAGIGIEMQDLFGRPAHSSGIGLTTVAISDIFFPEPQAVTDSETALELYYRYQLNTHISVKPDLQVLVSPSLAPQRDNVFVATVRLDAVF